MGPKKRNQCTETSHTQQDSQTVATVPSELDLGTKSSKIRKSWSSAEIESVLYYLIDVIKKGKPIEKPNAAAFYAALLKVVRIEDCSVTQVKHQVANLKKKYQSTVDWRNNTGQGVLEEHGDHYFKDVISKRCPHFDLLQEIFGEKLSITPPFTMDSSSVQNSENDKLGDFFDNNSHLLGVDNDDVDEIIASSPISNENSLLSKTSRTTYGIKRKAKSPVRSQGSKALTDLVNARQDMHASDIAFQREKWEEEKRQAEIKIQIEQDSLSFEHGMRLKQHDLEQQKITNQFEIEKYKIDQEMKIKLEIAKLQAGLNCD